MYLDVDKIETDVVAFDEQLALGELSVTPAERVGVVQARLTGEARRGDRGVELQAHLGARLRLPCSRCLEPFEHTLSTDFLLTLVGEATEFGGADVEIDEEDATLFYAENGRADLGVIATEQIYLNLPLKPVCGDGCKGLCPACGANRNRLECGCRDESPDPRLAPLLEFRRRFGGS